MRAIITLLVATVAIVGLLLYRAKPDARSQGMFATATSPPAESACATENAVFQYNEDQRLRLTFRRIPHDDAAGPEFSNGVGGRQIGNMAFVITVTSTAKGMSSFRKTE